VAASWRPAYVAIGSNLDDPRSRVVTAFEALGRLPESRALVRSRLYRSAPLGPRDQPDFLNAAAGFVTRLGARALLGQLLEIERAMGRERTVRWGPRVIDLDLVWLHGEILDEPGLTLPHPGVSSRNFVLYPLNDIAPTLTIPGVGTIRDLLPRVGDEGICVVQ
jgi:2-amino-4-hydroxy-6-hydroxymethyldihydropteridine diphosphokinase